MARRHTDSDSEEKAKKIISGEYRYIPQGDIPGNYEVDDNTKFPDIQIYSYQKEECIERNNFSSLNDLFTHLEAHKTSTHWINIEGHGNNDFLHQLQNYFGLHNLALEDVVHMRQRPKVENFETHYFTISRMLYYYQDELINEQIAFFVFDNILITIQEELEDCLESVLPKDGAIFGKETPII